MVMPPHPIQGSSDNFPWCDEGGNITQFGRSTIKGIVDAINGAIIVTPCTMANLNDILLTPFTASPKPTSASGTVVTYSDYFEYSFVCTVSSTGLMTCALSGMPRLNLYKNHGAVQANTGDMLINLFYKVAYVSSLNSNAGGFVIL